MPQIFRPKANLCYKIALIFILGLPVVVGCVCWEALWGSFYTDVAVARVQPTPFSHEHHVHETGIDCRFCHTGVETSAFAGMPSSKVCMTCHSQIWNGSSMLQPVRESWLKNQPIRWTRVHSLPDYVYFNHSIHLSKGIGCAECHGRVDEMPLTWKARSFYMRDCLSCHRDPAPHLRPQSEIFNLSWKPPSDPSQNARFERQLVHEYAIDRERIKDCDTCHR